VYILNELKTIVGLSLSLNRRLLCAAMVLLLSACGDSDVPEITVESAWIRAMPPGSAMTAGYFVLHNNGSEAIRIVAASSPEFASVSLHESIVTDGLSHMEEIAVLEVAAGESVTLAPGAKHLMLTAGNNGGQSSQCCTLSLEIEGREPLVFKAGIGKEPQ
jgi:copper(I)-binding protein